MDGTTGNFKGAPSAAAPEAMDGTETYGDGILRTEAGEPECEPRSTGGISATPSTGENANVQSASGTESQNAPITSTSVALQQASMNTIQNCALLSPTPSVSFNQLT
jgi:hypothetical protein